MGNQKRKDKTMTVRNKRRKKGSTIIDITLLLLPNTDRLQQVEDYVRKLKIKQCELKT